MRKCINFERHAYVYTPSIFIAHEPQIPSLQERRKVKVESCSFFILTNASRTIGPQVFKSTEYNCVYGLISFI